MPHSSVVGVRVTHRSSPSGTSLKPAGGGRLQPVPRWLLLHPPLLGPAVLRPLADELRRRGQPVALPDLRAAVDPAREWPERWTVLAAREGAVEVVVGCSGAGVGLP